MAGGPHELSHQPGNLKERERLPAPPRRGGKQHERGHHRQQPAHHLDLGHGLQKNEPGPHGSQNPRKHQAKDPPQPARLTHGRTRVTHSAHPENNGRNHRACAPPSHRIRTP